MARLSPPSHIGDVPTAPPTAKGKDTRRRIIECATDLFAQRGYAGVTVNDITRAAGLSPGAFYRYFTDRYSLTVELLEELTTNAFLESGAVADQGDPSATVQGSTLRYFEYYRDHSALFGLLVELSQSDDAVAALWETSRTAFYRRIARSLHRAMEDGSIRQDLDPDIAAELLGSMTEFYAFQRFVLRSSSVKSADLTVAARTIAELWLRGIQRP